MVLIWNRWGILAPGIAFLSFLASLPFASPVIRCVVFFVGGAATFVLGYWLNLIRPRPAIDGILARRQQELHDIVESGHYAIQGAPLPRSFEEARSMAATQLAAETTLVNKRLLNRNTCFWIPMQWFGPVIAVLGLMVLVQGVPA
jgi:hypothetical protein